jgi:hypothetical protein
VGVLVIVCGCSDGVGLVIAVESQRVASVGGVVGCPHSHADARFRHSDMGSEAGSHGHIFRWSSMMSWSCQPAGGHRGGIFPPEDQRNLGSPKLHKRTII